jgi:hypothetical protein
MFRWFLWRFRKQYLQKMSCFLSNLHRLLHLYLMLRVWKIKYKKNERKRKLKQKLKLKKKNWKLIIWKFKNGNKILKD